MSQCRAVILPLVYPIVFICLDIIDGAAGCVSESEFEDEDNKVVLPEEKSLNLYIFKEKKIQI